MKDYSGIPIALGLGLFLGVFIGWNVAESAYKTSAIQHHCAVYDERTGDWGWIERGGDAK